MNGSVTNHTFIFGNFTPPDDFFFGDSGSKLSPLGYVRLILSFLIIGINALEVTILVRKGENRCIPDHFVLSLAIADLTVGVLYALLDILALVRHLLSNSVIMVTMFVMLPCTWFSIHASILHTVCIAIERFVAVRYPLHYRGILTKTKVITCVLCLWLFILISTIILFFINFKLWHTSTLPITEGCLIISSGVLLSCIYGYIAWYVSARRRMNSKSDYRRRQSTITYGTSNETKKTIFCILIAVAFVICSYPVAFSWLLGIYHPTPIFILLLNSCFNPIIYFWKGYAGSSKRTPKKSFLLTDSSGQP